MTNDVWIGAITTLIGAVAGGAISFVLTRLQVKDARLQREDRARREDSLRSWDRRFKAYSEFLTRVRIFRTTIESYYWLPNHRPSTEQIESLKLSANEASAPVFLVVETVDTSEACAELLRAIERAQAVVLNMEASRTADTLTELSHELGAASRGFQNAVRKELKISGPAVPWDRTEEALQNEGSSPPRDAPQP